jgi:adenosylmethionine-8-amino-7-oxononanoate aminotransferase
MHGPTFMGNPLACAAANASLDLFEREPRLEQVARIEGWLREELTPAVEFPNVAEVRVKGAMGVIELRRSPDLNRLKTWFVEQGLFLRPFGSTLYTTPAYVTKEEDVRRLANALVVAAHEAGG